ncbi:MAG: bifunctional DNA-formamidopyrimidine glycosylase/DNA-(apurinic or apyrimidinic site) lyase [Rubrobacter sp.]|nr:bifunctional DNA-formamidopyrimidine glycosylase/DNA-(apurinic or apyrimidinic site) lyase [Rubrobacter sp.]
MPELPEVETIKEDLGELVVGSRIESAEVLDERLVEEPSPQEFAHGLSGRRIEGASRRAKHLIVEIEGGRRAVFQLKIGGQILLVPPAEEPERNLMMLLNLDGGRRLFLRDETEFSRARLLSEKALEERLGGIGPEPLEGGFSVEYLREAAGSRKAQIKPLLLDQGIVAGIGNIYVDEILYDARLHPRRKANTLSTEDWQSLCRAIRENLSDGIEHRGTTFSLYRDLLDRPGNHQNYLRVFERHGESCPECGGKILREKVGGRPTHYCPSCQKESGSGDEESQPTLI